MFSFAHPRAHDVLGTNVQLDQNGLLNNQQRDGAPTRHCDICNIDQPVRAKHCSSCNRCIDRYGTCYESRITELTRLNHRPPLQLHRDVRGREEQSRVLDLPRRANYLRHICTNDGKCATLQYNVHRGFDRCSRRIYRTSNDRRQSRPRTGFGTTCRSSTSASYSLASSCCLLWCFSITHSWCWQILRRGNKREDERSATWRIYRETWIRSTSAG